MTFWKGAEIFRISVKARSDLLVLDVILAYIHKMLLPGSVLVSASTLTRLDFCGILGDFVLIHVVSIMIVIVLTVNQVMLRAGV